MKTKANFFNQLIIIIISFLFSFFLGSFGPLLCYNPIFILEILGAIIIVSLLIIISFYVLNLIITLFMRPQIVFNKEEFKFKRKKYKYSEFKSMGFDLGEMLRTSNKPLAIYLYRENSDGLVINNPSLITIIKFKRIYNDKFHFLGFDLIKMILIIGFIGSFLLSTLLIVIN